MNQTLDQAVYQKYIQPTERIPGDFVGVEFEFPLLNLEKKPVNLPEVQKVVRDFALKFRFSNQKSDDNQNLYSLTNPDNGDNLSFDCSYNTLELSFGKESNIHVLNQRFLTYFQDLQENLLKIRHQLTGMGINPYHDYEIFEPVANDRYRMLYHHLHSYQNYGDVFYHDFPQFSMIAAASQVQLDVQKEQILSWIHVYNLLEPYKAILFANSYLDQLPERVISRDYLWRYSSQGYNPHNLDMYETDFQNLDEYISYIRSQSIYCVQKGDKYLHFKPIPLEHYIHLDSVKGVYFSENQWKEFDFKPEISDIADHRTFKFTDLTYRGTMEFRSACEQPVSEIFAHAAFHAGLARKTPELAEILDSDSVLYQHGYTAPELRNLFTLRNFPDFADQKRISLQLLKILELARDGLSERGYQEESFLEPLFRRAETLLSPAREMLAGLEKGDQIEFWIDQYSKTE
ncbi:MAG: glutamylcysteine synthetase [Oscillospiraceae bacterium]|nr:glutamylcysteine synthetase [Oscillospiraceae bacterium]